MERTGSVQGTGNRTSQVAYGAMPSGGRSPHFRHGYCCRRDRQFHSWMPGRESGPATPVSSYYSRLFPRRTFCPLGGMALRLFQARGKCFRVNVVPWIQGIHQGQCPAFGNRHGLFFPRGQRKSHQSSSYGTGGYLHRQYSGISPLPLSRYRFRMEPR